MFYDLKSNKSINNELQKNFRQSIFNLQRKMTFKYTAINKLPFELYLLEYYYCEPGRNCKQVYLDVIQESIHLIRRVRSTV